MIERKMGRQASCILSMVLGFLEYQARMQYGVQDYQPMFDLL